VLCDPYYRTIQGFRILVHKEWIFYKHNFALKSQMLRQFKPPPNNNSKGYLETGLDYFYAAKQKEIEPLFILFLDAVH
jgi:hypothetical protein